MTPMTPTEDIRAARHRLAAQFDNDLDRIVADLRAQQRESGREYITLPPRRPTRTDTTNKTMHVRTGKVRLTSGCESRLGKR
jgi:hypothetical protein